MKPDIFRDLEIGLQKDEKTLWISKPSVFRFFRDGRYTIIFLLVISFFTAIIFNLPESIDGVDLPTRRHVATPLALLISALVYSFCLIGKAIRTIYILTSHRAIIVESDLVFRRSTRVYTKEDKLGKFDVVEHGKEYGDIVFDQKIWKDGYFITKRNPWPDTSKPFSWIGPTDLKTSDYDKTPVEQWKPIGFLGINDLQGVAVQVKEVLG